MARGHGYEQLPGESPTTATETRQSSPTSLLSVITFSWLNGLLQLATERSLLETDLPVMEYKSASYSDDFFNVRNGRNGAKLGKTSPSLASTMNKLYGTHFWIACACEIIGEIFQLNAPLALSALIGFCTRAFDSQDDPGFSTGLGLALLLSGMQLLAAIFREQAFWRAYCQGAKARAALSVCIYRLGQSLSSTSRLSFPISKLLNMLSTDITRLETASGMYYWKYTEPLSLFVIGIALYSFVGWACLASFLVVFTMIPLQQRVNTILAKTREEIQQFTDQRAEALRESLLGIYVVKAYGWEKSCFERISAIRQQELQLLVKVKLVQEANVAIALSLPLILAVVTFSLVPVQEMSSQSIFGALTLFNLMFRPVALLPESLNIGSAVKISLKRMQQVFDAELETLDYSRKDREQSSAVSADGLTCAWPKLQEDSIITALRDVTFKYDKQLVAVVGNIGSGKSALLQALLGQLPVTAGSFNTPSIIAYCPQIVWLNSGTVRDIILFGSTFHQERYANILQACALECDLSLLPHGDQTLCGERGLNLSGGQKARIQLARALYSDAKVLLLDDPLAALDANTAKHVFDQAIRPAATTHTVFLVTHSRDIVQYADSILQMQHGSAFIYDDFSQWMDSQDKIPATEKPTIANLTKLNTDPIATIISIEADTLFLSEERSLDNSVFNGLRQFLAYSDRNTLFWLVAVIWVLAVICQVAVAQWLVFWQQNRFGLPSYRYIQIYAILGSLQTILMFGSALFPVLISYSASRRLHDKAVLSVLHAPLSFHHTTPLGRILSRFGKDVDCVDDTIAHMMACQVTQTSYIAAAAIICSTVQPLLVGFLGVTCAVVLVLSRYFAPSNRDFKQLSNLLRSRVFSTFSESLAGSAVINAMKKQTVFSNALGEAVDIENRAYFHMFSCQRWLALRIGSITCLGSFLVAIGAVFQRHSINPVQIGLALSSIVSSQNSFEWILRNNLNLANYLDSSRRLAYYATEIDQEQLDSGIQSSLKRGELSFEDASMRYRDDTPLVLEKVSFKIPAGTRLAICGRTGSGKTSLINACFRFMELAEGRICIDGVDISELSLSKLRESISLIPQDTVLMTGTIRINLDPMGKETDANLWKALVAVGLYQPGTPGSSQSRFHLDSVAVEGGQAFSVGERALISLARAFVKNSSIIVLDETTSSLDAETDAFILRAIEKIFATKTQLTIAHRIHSTLSHDLVLVLDQGKVREFGSPKTLYASNGIYASLCRAMNAIP